MLKQHNNPEHDNIRPSSKVGTYVDDLWGHVHIRDPRR